MHDQVISFILSNNVSIALSMLAFLLACLYVLDFILVKNGRKRHMRKEGILLRIFNWVAFGVIFLLFGQVILVKEVETWRATARMALTFLMLSEALFEIATLIPAIKRIIWKKGI